MSVSGDLPILFLQITSELLCQFLRGTRAAEHTVPVEVVTKFNNTMKELEQLLGRLGQAILQREHVRIFIAIITKIGKERGNNNRCLSQSEESKCM